MSPPNDASPEPHRRPLFRAGTFYIIDLPDTEDLSAHAEANPGTLRIEDVFGNILWRPQ